MLSPLPLAGLFETGLLLLEVALIKLWRVEMGALVLMPVLTFDLHSLFFLLAVCIAGDFRGSCHHPLPTFILLCFTTRLLLFLWFAPVDKQQTFHFSLFSVLHLL